MRTKAVASVSWKEKHFVYGGIQQQENEFQIALRDLVTVNFKGLHDSYYYVVIAGDVFEVRNVPFSLSSDATVNQ